MNMIQQFKENSDGLKQQHQSFRSQGQFTGMQGQIVESIYLDSSSVNVGTGAGIGAPKFKNTMMSQNTIG
jgi:hypothetical protein